MTATTSTAYSVPGGLVAVYRGLHAQTDATVILILSHSATWDDVMKLGRDVLQVCFIVDVRCRRGGRHRICALTYCANRA